MFVESFHDGIAFWEPGKYLFFNDLFHHFVGWAFYLAILIDDGLESSNLDIYVFWLWYSVKIRNSAVRFVSAREFDYVRRWSVSGKLSVDGIFIWGLRVRGDILMVVDVI